MEETITKQVAVEALSSTKETVADLQRRIENPEDVERIGKEDVEDLKEVIEGWNERIAEIESALDLLPASPNEQKEMDELKTLFDSISFLKSRAESRIGILSTEAKDVAAEEKGTVIEIKEALKGTNIMDENLLDKIAQLEAIDRDTHQFIQELYDNYINSEDRRGKYSVTGNQQMLKEKVESGEDLEDCYFDTETIAGTGNVNRYSINVINGMVELNQGNSGTNVSGSPEYKKILAQKAQELGILIKA